MKQCEGRVVPLVYVRPYVLLPGPASIKAKACGTYRHVPPLGGYGPMVSLMYESRASEHSRLH
jgi:hypothetical protein